MVNLCYLKCKHDSIGNFRLLNRIRSIADTGCISVLRYAACPPRSGKLWGNPAAVCTDVCDCITLLYTDWFQYCKYTVLSFKIKTSIE